MNLYFFPNYSYGPEFAVMAKSRAEALKFVIKHCEEQNSKREYPSLNWFNDVADFALNNELIKEYGEGFVVETEIS